MIEAAAMGVPVIGTDTTGIRDSMLHNFNGIMVAPNSADLLENAMLQLYKNVEMRKKFAKNGLNWAANFGNHVIWRGIEEIYN
jgi:glycosyltransferase involved in cell wall biosynthesis